MRHLLAVLALVWAGLLPFVALPTLAWAQSPLPGAISADDASWARTAQVVSAFLEDKTGSDDDLLSLRARVQTFRNGFVAQQGANNAQIMTLKDQIAALGPPPEGDAVETREVADRRKALQADLARAQEPVVKAVEAQAQAEAMLRALGDLDRERQAGRILRLSPSPLDPKGWSALVGEASALASSLSQELQEGWAQRLEGWARARLPGAMGSVLVGLVLLVGGWRTARRGLSRLLARLPFRAQAAATFVASSLQVLFPMVGLYLALRGVAELGLFGPWWRGLMVPLLGAATAALLGFWIVRLFFDSDATHAAYIAPARKIARRHAMALVALFALYRFVAQTGSLRVGRESVFLGPLADIPTPLGEAASEAIVLPLVALAAVALWGFDKLRQGALRSQPVEVDGVPPDLPYRVRLLGVLSGVGKYAGLAALGMALSGYVALANYTMWSSVLTLGGALLLLSIHGFLTSAWAAFSGRPADQGLAPVLAAFALIVVAFPLFALAWGMRPESLTELAGAMGRGFAVGDVTLSPRVIVLFCAILVVGVVVTRAIKGVFKTTVLPRTGLDPGAQSAAVAGIGYVGIFLAVLVSIMSAGIDLASLAIVAGALSVGIGFGLQNIISNFVSGIILLIERPISVGDWIDAGGQQGTVRSVSVRSTRIRTFDNTEVIVPNSDLISNAVTNWTRGSTVGRITVPVIVGFGTDTERAEEVLLDIARGFEEVLPTPGPHVFFSGFAPNGYALELRAFLRDIRDNIRIYTLVRHAIVRRFAQEGIVIAPAFQDVRILPAAGSPPLPGLAPPPGGGSVQAPGA